MERDLSWMYFKQGLSGFLRTKFVNGVEEFISFAFYQPRYVLPMHTQYGNHMVNHSMSDNHQDILFMIMSKK
ncbi:Uncharacterized protein TCM_009113 [Theobroma cacao]|uniref:Uncharacterized protein n=1 Tax=Theobroma cacao TaxID=3641 RepID=A0A061E4R3_THECC|nr:Uncharacterized protein TCM_009113 [Theobroma cacao]